MPWGSLCPLIRLPASCWRRRKSTNTSIGPDDKHYSKRKADLDDRRYKIYDKIENTEKWQLMKSLLSEARIYEEG